MEAKKTALITGASRGIGKAIAEQFAAAGYDLVLTCLHSEEIILQLKSKLEHTYQIKCTTFVGDMGDCDCVEALSKILPPINVLVNNAGISYVGLLQEMSLEDWNRILNTNLTSAFLLTKKILPGMIARKQGKILNISSVWGNVGASMEVAYSASKGGLNSFTKALAKELGPSNIQVNAIACGIIDTDMNHYFSKEDIASIVSEIPADRMGKAEEVAKVALQLITDNEYLTGQIITLDGGWI